MRTSWADSAADDSAAPAPSLNDRAGANPARSTYVPPHLRKSPAVSEPPPGADRFGHGGGGGVAGVGANRFGHGGGGAVIRDLGRVSGFGGGRAGGGGGGRGSRGREREVNPFENDENVEKQFGEQENTGINFDAYEDIPVETSGQSVPPPVNSFAEIDLGNAVDMNIKRCKYAKPTPVQRHAIPIALAGRDLMACAQTGSGKTAAFCFPIISGIMNSQASQRSRGGRTVYPLALILSPTRELSCQVSSHGLSLPCFFFLKIPVNVHN